MRELKFTPLEFETVPTRVLRDDRKALKFTPLEFETHQFLTIFQGLTR